MTWPMLAVYPWEQVLRFGALVVVHFIIWLDWRIIMEELS